jgi:hypothetical protein
VLAAAHRIGIDPGQAEQSGHDRLGAFRAQLGVVGPRLGEGAEHRHRHSCRAARRVHRELCTVAQPLDTGAILAPRGKPRAPALRFGGGKRRDVLRCPRRVIRVDPEFKLGTGQAGEVEQQVTHIALGVDHQHGHAIQRSFLNQVDGEARLAAARHTHAQAVGDEVGGVVEQRDWGGLAAGLVHGAAEVEHA